MSSDSSAGTPESKEHKAIHTMIIKNVGSLCAQEKTKWSCTFTCPEEPQPTSFKMKIEFSKQNKCIIFIYPMNRTAQITLQKYTIHDEKMVVLGTQFYNEKRTVKRGTGLGWPYYAPGDVGNVDWRITCEVGYEGAPGSGPTQCQCDASQMSNHVTLSKNMLTLLDDATSSDVTLLVGGEKLKAHKGHLIARSMYFRSLFHSGMIESLSDEVELNEDPLIFKEALKFMYSGLTPENLDDIAIQLLPLADKYLLSELKQLCDTAIRRILSVENIAEVLRIANDHNCPDLFKYCVPFFKANVKVVLKPSSLSQSLLEKLLEACCD